MKIFYKILFKKITKKKEEVLVPTMSGTINEI
jgi:hypothetical protein